MRDKIRLRCDGAPEIRGRLHMGRHAQAGLMGQANELRQQRRIKTGLTGGRRIPIPVFMILRKRQDNFQKNLIAARCTGFTQGLFVGRSVETRKERKDGAFASSDEWGKGGRIALTVD